jgi:hypothetical protein
MKSMGVQHVRISSHDEIEFCMITERYETDKEANDRRVLTEIRQHQIAQDELRELKRLQKKYKDHKSITQ